MSWSEDNYQEPPDDLFETADEEEVWVTKDGKYIEYGELETAHIKNIIKRFELTDYDMPNLFEELKKRSS